MAWQFDRPATGDGMVQAFRRSQSPIEKARFKLRGLDPAARVFRDAISTRRAKRKFTGRELEEQGLPVAIKDQPGAMIIVYKQVKR